MLARLEEQGFVRQPHTSAGRVPTDSGYRLYVDSLLDSRRRPRSGREVDVLLPRAGTVDSLMAHVSQELSRVSHQIGFAFSTATPSTCLRHLDFAKLDDRRVLVIVVTTGGHVTHRVIETDEPYDGASLPHRGGCVTRCSMTSARRTD